MPDLTRIEKLAEKQATIYNELGEYLDWFITFSDGAELMEIVNPFVSCCMRFTVDPYKEYGQDFADSDWFNSEKVDELERRLNEYEKRSV